MKDAWPFPLPEITLLILFAQNLTKAGGDVSVSTNAVCWKPGCNVPS